MYFTQNVVGFSPALRAGNVVDLYRMPLVLYQERTLDPPLLRAGIAVELYRGSFVFDPKGHRIPLALHSGNVIAFENMIPFVFCNIQYRIAKMTKISLALRAGTLVI